MIQSTIDFGKVARDEGINRAVNHANQVVGNWSERVFNAFKEYLIMNQKQPFQIEDFREWLGDSIPPPPHNRAFGSIATKAIKAGLIYRIGFAPVSNPKAHRANSAVWMRV